MAEEKKAAIRIKISETRSALLALLQDLTAEEWHTAVQSEDAQWTLADVVRHLINAEKGMTGLIVQFQQGNDPVPPDFDRERYNVRAVQKSQALTPADMLHALEMNHANLLQVIDSLSADDWQKKGRHASLHIMSVEEVCHTIADHESWHLADIKQALGR